MGARTSSSTKFRTRSGAATACGRLSTRQTMRIATGPDVPRGMLSGLPTPKVAGHRTPALQGAAAMERKQASDFPQELLDLFHLYVHGDIDRRGFFDRASKFAVGGVTVAGLF